MVDKVQTPLQTAILYYCAIKSNVDFSTSKKMPIFTAREFIEYMAEKGYKYSKSNVSRELNLLVEEGIMNKPIQLAGNSKLKWYNPNWAEISLLFYIFAEENLAYVSTILVNDTLSKSNKEFKVELDKITGLTKNYYYQKFVCKFLAKEGFHTIAHKMNMELLRTSSNVISLYRFIAENSLPVKEVTDNYFYEKEYKQFIRHVKNKTREPVVNMENKLFWKTYFNSP